MGDVSSLLMYVLVLALCGVGAMYFMKSNNGNKGPSQSSSSSNEMNVIKLTHPSDIGFSQIAQGSSVGGATLPSGFKVPSDGTWIIKGDTLVRQ